MILPQGIWGCGWREYRQFVNRRSRHAGTPVRETCLTSVNRICKFLSSIIYLITTSFNTSQHRRPWTASPQTQPIPPDNSSPQIKIYCKRFTISDNVQFPYLYFLRLHHLQRSRNTNNHSFYTSPSNILLLLPFNSSSVRGQTTRPLTLETYSFCFFRDI